MNYLAVVAIRAATVNFSVVQLRDRDVPITLSLRIVHTTLT